MTLESKLAGTWYPGTAREIRALAETWEKALGKDGGTQPVPNVLLLPHAGWAYSEGSFACAEPPCVDREPPGRAGG